MSPQSERLWFGLRGSFRSCGKRNALVPLRHIIIKICRHGIKQFTGDAVPLGPALLISSGFDLETNRSTAILFNNAGEILYTFNHVELLSLKFTGRIPPSVSIPTAFDERGCNWLSAWVHELSQGPVSAILTTG